jgi:hypothetical protein
VVAALKLNWNTNAMTYCYHTDPTKSAVPYAVAPSDHIRLYLATPGPRSFAKHPEARIARQSHPSINTLLYWDNERICNQCGGRPSMLHYSVNQQYKEGFLASAPRGKDTWLACSSAMLLTMGTIRQYLGSRGTPQLGRRQQAKGSTSGYHELIMAP